MSRERLILLGCLVGFFALLSGVFIWGQVFNAHHYLPPGTRPPEEQVVQAQLPPIRRTDPVLGTNDKKLLTIVEFADFNCVYCRLSAPQLKAALAPVASQVRVIWRDLPLGIDTADGRLPATAGRCALEQGKFWEMHDALFAAQSLDIDALKQIGAQLGLDRNRYEACLSSDKYAQALKDDVSIARSHGILSGPTFFIGKHVVNGYLSSSELLDIIQAELASK